MNVLTARATPGPRFGHRDPDARGYFGEFGGRFVPETLMGPVDDLAAAYLDARRDERFVAELGRLLSRFVGRATPLDEARRIAAGTGVRVFLKREDLAHPAEPLGEERDLQAHWHGRPSVRRAIDDRRRVADAFGRTRRRQRVGEHLETVAGHPCPSLGCDQGDDTEGQHRACRPHWSSHGFRIRLVRGPRRFLI